MDSTSSTKKTIGLDSRTASRPYRNQHYPCRRMQRHAPFDVSERAWYEILRCLHQIRPMDGRLQEGRRIPPQMQSTLTSWLWRLPSVCLLPLTTGSLVPLGGRCLPILRHHRLALLSLQQSSEHNGGGHSGEKRVPELRLARLGRVRWQHSRIVRAVDSPCRFSSHRSRTRTACHSQDIRRRCLRAARRISWPG